MVEAINVRKEVIKEVWKIKGKKEELMHEEKNKKHENQGEGKNWVK